MQCFVIAHPQSTNVNECVRSLQKHRWSHEIFPAVDGWALTDRDWQKIGVKIGGGKIGRRPGAQGCWHSHFCLWQKCVDLAQPLIILECDVLVTYQQPMIDCSTQLIKLYKTAVCKTHPVFGRWSKGSHGYAISPDLARSLIAFSQQYGAEALDKHLGDQVVPWSFYHQDLVVLNPKRERSTTSTATRPW